MLDRAWDRVNRKSPRRGRQPRFESLEGRELLTASLAPISALNVPTTLGYQLPLNGSGDSSGNQTFNVTSSNPDIKVSVASGKFLQLQVNHTAQAGNSNDVSFAGTLTFQLFQDLTPQTVTQIESMITSGFYNTANAGSFNRIANGFPTTSDYIVQGGSITGTTAGNSGQPGTPFIDEFNPQLAFTGQGQLAMANSGPDTNDSQFFITTTSAKTIDSYRSLDFGYTIFGQLVADPNNILPQMSKVAVDSSNKPLSPVNFTPTLSTTNPNGVLHVDATSAAAGEKSTITVTATDPTDHSTVVQSFPVTVIPNNNSSGNPVVEKPFLKQLSLPTTVITPSGGQPQVVYTQSVSKNQPFIFQIQGYSATPGNQLTYTVQGGVTTSSTTGQTFTQVQNATTTVDQSTGVVTVTPTAGFTGTINLLVGVRDQTNRAGNVPGTTTPYALDSPPNYDYHQIQLTVTSSTTPVPLAPLASPVNVSAQAGTPTTITLKGTSSTPSLSSGLTYTLLSQPTNGTITNFNPSTGTFVYTPKANFSGTDSLQYQVTDHLGNTVLSSTAATVNITNTLATTGAVRMIGNVLVVTPNPSRTNTPNTIEIGETTNANGGQGNNLIYVLINGTLDATQPLDSNVDRIVVFGAKASDKVTVDSTVNSQIPVTLDGGHGGVNVLQAGGGPTREHGWFGQNTLIGGTGDNQLIGREGHVRFRPTATTSVIFAGQGHAGSSIFKGKADYRSFHINPPTGTFFRYVNGRLIPTTPAGTGAGVAPTRPARTAHGRNRTS